MKKSNANKKKGNSVAAVAARVAGALAPKLAKAGHKAAQPRSGLFPGYPGKIGSFLGGIFGPTGKKLGKEAGDWLGSITGLGEYQVNRNTLLTDNGPPSFHSSANGSARITHREFIGNVDSAQAFTTRYQSLINPTDTGLFPWLSSVARNYDQHQWKGLVFSFKTTSGTAVGSTNTALGNVIIATNYDVYDPVFTTKVQMENYQFCTSCVPFQNMIHPIECKPSNTSVEVLYNDSNTGDGDIRLNNIGRLQVAVCGQQVNDITLGELWVSYDIELIKPKLQNTGSDLDAQSFFIRQFWGGGASAGATVLDHTIAQTNNDYNTSNVIPYQVGIGPPDSIFFTQAGVWEMYVSLTGSAGNDLSIAGYGCNGIFTLNNSNVSVANGRANYSFRIDTLSTSSNAARLPTSFTLGHFVNTNANAIEMLVNIYPQVHLGTYVSLPSASNLLNVSGFRSMMDRAQRQIASLKDFVHYHETKQEENSAGYIVADQPSLPPTPSNLTGRSHLVVSVPKKTAPSSIFSFR